MRRGCLAQQRDDLQHKRRQQPPCSHVVAEERFVPWCHATHYARRGTVILEGGDEVGEVEQCENASAEQRSLYRQRGAGRKPLVRAVEKARLLVELTSVAHVGHRTARQSVHVDERSHVQPLQLHHQPAQVDETSADVAICGDARRLGVLPTCERRAEHRCLKRPVTHWDTQRSEPGGSEPAASGRNGHKGAEIISTMVRSRAGRSIQLAHSKILGGGSEEERRSEPR